MAVQMDLQVAGEKIEYFKKKAEFEELAKTAASHAAERRRLDSSGGTIPVPVWFTLTPTRDATSYSCH